MCAQKMCRVMILPKRIANDQKANVFLVSIMQDCIHLAFHHFSVCHNDLLAIILFLQVSRDASWASLMNTLCTPI